MADEAQSALNAAGLAAKLILQCGGETYRAEETVVRMCAGFGFAHTEVIAFPTGAQFTAFDERGCAYTQVVRVEKRAIRLQLLDEINAVSRKVALEHMPPEEALRELLEISHAPSQSPWLMVAACAASAGLFSLMFDGGILEFLVAALCGGAAQAVTPALSKLRVPPMLTSLLLGFLTAFLALPLADALACSHEAAVSGAIMPLLPGLAMMSAIRDTLRGDLVSGVARGTEALMSAVLLAAGAGIMYTLWGGLA